MNTDNEGKTVARLAEIVARECGVRSNTAGLLRTAAVMHDIGKIKIPKSMLNKPGKLTKQEFEIMKTHTTIGAELLKSIQGELGVMSRTICRYHHEWFDGIGGYWCKHTGELPEYVAIVAITDVFVALVSERAYKSAWPPVEALAYIERQAGTQFNPALTKIFIRLVRNDGRIASLFLHENNPNFSSYK